MPFDAQFNFRATNAGSYAGIDQTGETYCLGDAWTGSVVRDGLIFGWTQANGTTPVSPTTRDRTTGSPNTPELSGINYIGNGSQRTFRLTLPSPGDYDLTIALGDYLSSALQFAYVWDGISNVIWTIADNGGAGISTSANNFLNINGISRTATQWQAERTTKTLTFSTTDLHILIGHAVGGTALQTTLSHLRVADSGTPQPAFPVYLLNFDQSI